MSLSDSDAIPSFPEVRDFLFGLRNRGSKYGIGRMERLAEALGHPQRKFPVIHVAGTNGKGSVCALLESALRRGGLKTGLYSSPHLVHLGERVQVNREPLTEERIIRLTEMLREAARKVVQESDDDYPSFFEFMTAMAFLQFAEESVDCAMLEVGLGGRLDATNIVTPEVSIITSIGLDHTEILGETITKIAGEKSGILKAGIPVVMGLLPSDAEGVVRERAAELSCPVHSVRDRFREAELPETNLVGRFQRWNAGTAQLALEVVRTRFPLDPCDMRSAFQNTVWSGRWEERKVGSRSIIFDSTHNPQGAEVLAENLQGRFGSPRGELEVVVGSLGLARAWAVLRVVAPYARRILIVRPSQPRALSFDEMRSVVPASFQGEVLETSVEELFPGGDCARFSEGPDPVLLTGSIYLIGEVFSRLQSDGLSETLDLQDRI
ncbi:bifunctional folylpolyglutamate synthase/dihydrofolate synthase [Puniceicoccus vermicola]|uniref:tetrahydrofolate synthase n=1 Tax=Puniceicoccus vermicola TaxID=388746 RepID=A0A7X1E2W4_9BACT|nr:folylpolyglutamate synthase/dihydrofolate synthase family protein [Puniceicoccus vermicola]MBC2600890.1 bifunctional folylpolyglutamate synthase/dihydrofolate synthase [Puniceicoccus vermicola]